MREHRSSSRNPQPSPPRYTRSTRSSVDSKPDGQESSRRRTRLSFKEPEDDSSSGSSDSNQSEPHIVTRRRAGSRGDHSGNGDRRDLRFPTHDHDSSPPPNSRRKPEFKTEDLDMDQKSPNFHASRAAVSRKERRVISDHESSSDEESEGWVQTANQIITKLLRDPEAKKIFGEPVDPKALGLDDYFEIVKNPMDLGTIAKRLNPHTRNQRRERYPGPDEFVRDVQLTFNNAILYNPATDDVHIFAAELLLKFNAMWKRANGGRMWSTDRMQGSPSKSHGTRGGAASSLKQDESADESGNESGDVSKEAQTGASEGRRSRSSKRATASEASAGAVDSDNEGGDGGDASDNSCYVEPRREQYQLRNRDNRDNRATPRSAAQTGGGSSSSHRRSQPSRFGGGRRGAPPPQKLKLDSSRIVTEGGMRLRIFDTDASEEGENVAIDDGDYPEPYSLRPSTVVFEHGRKFRVFEYHSSDEETMRRNFAANSSSSGGGKGGYERFGNGGAGAGARSWPRGGGWDGDGMPRSGGGGGGDADKRPPRPRIGEADLFPDGNGGAARPEPLDLDLVDPEASFDRIGGLDENIRKLKESIFLPLTYPEVFASLNIEAPKGVLFYGPPGTGKTLVARALARSCGAQGGRKVTFFMTKGAELHNKFIGESDRQLIALFNEATARQPSIIFFDEIDGLAPMRNSREGQCTDQLVSTLLSLMDGVTKRGNVVIIGATNRPDAVDPALRRPGRFDREFYFPLPDAAARCKILEIYTKNWTPPLSRELLERVSDGSAGFGGADLKALCTEAALRALRRTYPQVYSNERKLRINKDQIFVTDEDLLESLVAIRATSKRSGASLGTSLPPAIDGLLRPLLHDALIKLAAVFPPALPAVQRILGGGVGGSNPTATSAASAGMEVDTTSSRPVAGDGPAQNAKLGILGLTYDSTLNFKGLDVVFRPRLLLSGRFGDAQTYVARALIQALDPLPAFALDLPSLHQAATGRVQLEEALVGRVADARARSPSILFIPDLHLWWQTANEPVRACLEACLRGLSPSEPVLVLATIDHQKGQDLTRALEIFRKGNELALRGPFGESELRAAFAPLERNIKTWSRLLSEVTGASFSLPQLHNSDHSSDEAQTEIEVVPDEELAVASGPQQYVYADPEQRARDEKCMRGMRMNLREACGNLIRKRQFKAFHLPVLDSPYMRADESLRRNYLACIAPNSPMDLSTLLFRINTGVVQCRSHFLAQIEVIRDNALKFNAPADLQDDSSATAAAAAAASSSGGSSSNKIRQKMHSVPVGQDQVLKLGAVVEVECTDAFTKKNEWVNGKIVRVEVDAATDQVKCFDVHIIMENKFEKGSWTEENLLATREGEEWRWPASTAKISEPSESVTLGVPASPLKVEQIVDGESTSANLAVDSEIAAADIDNMETEVAAPPNSSSIADGCDNVPDASAPDEEDSAAKAASARRFNENLCNLAHILRDEADKYCSEEELERIDSFLCDACERIVAENRLAKPKPAPPTLPTVPSSTKNASPQKSLASAGARRFLRSMGAPPSIPIVSAPVSSVDASAEATVSNIVDVAVPAANGLVALPNSLSSLLNSCGDVPSSQALNEENLPSDPSRNFHDLQDQPWTMQQESNEHSGHANDPVNDERVATGVNVESVGCKRRLNVQGDVCPGIKLHYMYIDNLNNEQPLSANDIDEVCNSFHDIQCEFEGIDDQARNSKKRKLEVEESGNDVGPDQSGATDGSSADQAAEAAPPPPPPPPPPPREVVIEDNAELNTMTSALMSKLVRSATGATVEQLLQLHAALNGTLSAHRANADRLRVVEILDQVTESTVAEWGLN